MYDIFTYMRFSLYMIFTYAYSYISLLSGLSQTHNIIDHLSMWLGSSVDRALHWFCKVMGLKPIREFF